MDEQRAPLLKGRGASSGTATGPVKKVLGSLASDFPEGAVLVARMTDPSMLMHMLRAVAIVTDTGGTTSHAAIVSRELGIPCVVATERATDVLQDGMVVEVDGAAGVVYSQ